jgi:hypothetical protein
MPENDKKSDEVHELAGGFTLFALAYLWNYWRGEVDNASRGALVQQFNTATGDPGGLIFAVIAICVAGFAAGLWFYAIVRKPTHED